MHEQTTIGVHEEEVAKLVYTLFCCKPVMKDHHISDKDKDHRSKVKVTKVKNVKKKSVFSLVSENVVKGQGHEDQG